MMLVVQDDPLLGPKLKLGRARKHMSDLASAIDGFFSKEPYRIDISVNPDSGYHEFRLRVLKRIPDEVGLITGDVVQNLRAALDLTACCLALQNNPKASLAGVYFPISKDLHDLKKPLKDGLRKLTQEARDFIKGMKPYGGGNDDYWKLHRLAIHDRHRVILPSWAGCHSVDIPIPQKFASLMGEDPKLATLPIIPKDQYEALENGSLIYQVAPSAFDRLDRNTSTQIAIAFSIDGAFKAAPISQTLDSILGTVERTISAVEQRFFH